MSQLLQGLPSPLAYTEGFASPNHFKNGLPFESDGSLAIDTFNTAIDHYHQGLPFTSTGRISAAIDTPVVRVGGGGAPFNALGELVFSSNPVAYSSCGINYTAAGQITNGTFTPITGDMILVPHNFVITADINDDLDSNNATP